MEYVVVGVVLLAVLLLAFLLSTSFSLVARHRGFAAFAGAQSTAALMLSGALVLMGPGCSRPAEQIAGEVSTAAPQADIAPQVARPQAEIDGGNGLGVDSDPIASQTDQESLPPTAADATSTSVPATTTVAAPPVPKPTPEQLAQWQQPPFDPLQLLARYHVDEMSFVSCAATSPDGEWLVLGGNKLTLWKAVSHTLVATLWEFNNSDSDDKIVSLAFAPNGRWVAAGDAKGRVRIWSLANQQELISKQVLKNDVLQIAVSDDSQEISLCSYSREVVVVSATSLEPKKRFETDGNTRMQYLDASKLIVAEKSMTLWDTATGMQLETIFEKGYSTSLTRSKDLSWYAMASDKELRVNHVSETERRRVLSGDFASGELLEFGAENRVLWSANGSTIRAWDAENGTILQVIDVFGYAIVAIDWLAKEQLLCVITEDGTIKLWGTRAAGQQRGLQPLHTSPEMPSGNPPEPATAVQLLATIDPRSLPRPPQSQATISLPTLVQFETATAAAEVHDFYRYTLHQLGWIEQPGNVHTPSYMNFKKNGFGLFISVTASPTSGTSVQLVSSGNVNTATIPKLTGFPISVQFESEATTSYTAKSDLLSIEVALLRQLHADGWLPYTRLNSSHNETADRRDLVFVRQAVTLHATIQAQVDDPASFVISYTTFLATAHLPVPDDCDYIECDVDRIPALVAFTSLSLDACQDFYQRVMLQQGWLPGESRRNPEGSVAWITFFQGQKELTLRLSRGDDDRTLILTGEYAVANSWQLAPKENAASETDKPREGLEAADLAIYKQSDAKSVKYDTMAKQIEVTLPTTSHIEIVDFYAKSLGEQGWQEEPNGFRAEDYAFVTFTKNDVSIQVRVNSRPSLNETSFSLSDDGILWGKPLPERHELLSYEAWLRKKRHPATLRLLEQFETEMRSP